MCSENSELAIVAYRDPKKYAEATKNFPIVKRILSITTGLPSTDTLVDLCSGPGTLTSFEPERLISYDISPEMCEVMRQKGAEANCCDISDGFEIPPNTTVLFIGSACLFTSQELKAIYAVIIAARPERVIISLNTISGAFAQKVREVNGILLHNHGTVGTLETFGENNYRLILREDMETGWTQPGFTIPSTILVFERAA
jgi:hypothetical protein